MLGTDLKKRLDDNHLPATWLASVLEDRGYSITPEALRGLMQDRSTNLRNSTSAIIHEAHHILNQYDAVFNTATIKVGDYVEGETIYGEYVAGKVLEIKPKLIVETYEGYRVPCYRPQQYTPTEK